MFLRGDDATGPCKPCFGRMGGASPTWGSQGPAVSSPASEGPKVSLYSYILLFAFVFIYSENAFLYYCSIHKLENHDYVPLKKILVSSCFDPQSVEVNFKKANALPSVLASPGLSYTYCA